MRTDNAARNVRAFQILVYDFIYPFPEKDDAVNLLRQIATVLYEKITGLQDQVQTVFNCIFLDSGIKQCGNRQLNRSDFSCHCHDAVIFISAVLRARGTGKKQNKNSGLRKCNRGAFPAPAIDQILF